MLFRSLFELDDVKLEFTQDALMAVAELAAERKTGARGLRSILENIMTDLMYEIPSDDTIGIVTITRDVISGEGKPEIVYRDTAVPRAASSRRMRKDQSGEIA